MNNSNKRPKDVKEKSCNLKNKKTYKKLNQNNGESDLEAPLNPPVSFFYSQVREKRKEKAIERLAYEKLELKRKHLTHEEKRALEATKLHNATRQQNIALNKQKSRYGAIAPRSQMR